MIYYLIFNTGEKKRKHRSVFESFLWRRNWSTDLRNPFQACSCTLGPSGVTRQSCWQGLPLQRAASVVNEMNWDTIQKLPIKSRLNYELKKERKKRKRRKETNRICRLCFSHQHTAGSCRRPSSPAGISFRPCTRTDSRSCLASALFQRRKIMNDFSKTHELKRNIWDV
jgi:hypothetical protein